MPHRGPQTPCWEPVTADLIGCVLRFIISFVWLLIFCSAGKLTALSWFDIYFLSDWISLFYHNVILHMLPKPHCRTCSFVIFRFLSSLSSPLFPTSARSEHRSRIITPQRNLSAGCHLIFFPPQMQSVIRNPCCHGDAIFGAECLLPHFF